MPNPITHLIWGYSISKNITKNKDYIIFGILVSIFADIDYIIPAFEHHGFVHTPIFSIIIAVVVLLIFKSRVLFGVTLVNLLFHLFLDTIGTNIPIMWIYPISENGLALGTDAFSYKLLILVNVILIIIPVIYVIYCYLRYGENPLDLVKQNS